MLARVTKPTQKVISMAKVWKIAPGKHAEDWDLFREHGCIGLGWLERRDYRDFKNEDDVLSALKQEPRKNKKGYGSGAAKMIWRFVDEIKKSDIVVANEGYNRVVGIGMVESQYMAPGSRKNPIRDDKTTHRHHIRLVKWLINKPVDLSGNQFFPQATLGLLDATKVEQIKQAYLLEYGDDREFKAELDQLFGGILADVNDDSAMDELLAAAEQQLANDDAFDPKGIKDARERIFSSIVRRRGQPAFRRHLIAAYRGRCAITGCDVEAVLEAAHIIPYKGPQTNHPCNGLLLRGDLHTLFDLRLIAVDVETMRLLVSPNLNGTNYESYRGELITVPSKSAIQPSRDALEEHCRESGLS